MTAPTHVPAPDPMPARGTYSPTVAAAVASAVDALYMAVDATHAEHYASRDPFDAAAYARAIDRSTAALTAAWQAIHDLAEARVADGAAS